MNDPEVVIRRAEESDLDAVYDLTVELGYSRLARADFAAAFAAVLRHPEMLVLIAGTPGIGAAGLASLSYRPQLRLGGRIATIDELVVTDRARGVGVGRALLHRAVAEARGLGARRVELTTNRDRESYRRGFYVKNGLAETGSALMRLELDRPPGV